MARGFTNSMKLRTKIVLGLLLAGFAAIIVRFGILMIGEHEFWQAKALDQQLYDTVIEAQRGTVYDRNMEVLAKSATVWTVYISPMDISDEERDIIADGLSEILDVDREDIYKASQNKTYYEIIKRRVESDKIEEVREFVEENELGSCVGEEISTKRYYPNGAFLSSVLGFVGDDNTGLSGLEAYYDDTLSGTDGRVVAAKTARGADMPFNYEIMEDAKDGNSIVLTIDKVIQYFVEEELEQVAEENLAAGASCIVMDVETGAILAMGQTGDFDPNSPFTIADSKLYEAINKLSGEERTDAVLNAQQEQWRNTLISDTYEPGSVFKMFTGSAAYEESVVNENSTFYCPGYIKIASETISCHDTDGHGTLTLTDAFVKSCNPAFIEIGQQLGVNKFYGYFNGFGFTAKTGVDMPGEASSLYYTAENMGIVELASESFGQSTAVTPIQMVTAACAIANGGYLLEPHIVAQVLDENGNIVKNTDTVVKRQVISEETSEAVLDMLSAVVLSGSGKNASVPGYTIAGKTGTSEKLQKNLQLQAGERKYYVASFLGIAPADDPQIAILLLVDEPMGDSIYGGTIAAPAVSSILSQVLPYLGIDPEYTEEELENMDAVTPSLVGDSVSDAKAELDEAGLEYSIVGSGDEVTAQTPNSGKAIPQGGTVVLYTEGTDTGKATVPDFTGLTVSAVNSLAVEYGLNVSLVGANLEESGAISYKQSVDADEKVDTGSVIKVYFRHSDSVE